MIDSPPDSESPPAADGSPDGSGPAYCARRVRSLDHDRYLSAVFAPRERRAALFALYAFNIEIAAVREAVSEPMLGEIRLQWWREAIGELYTGRPRRHAVVTALADAVKQCGLPRALLEEMIDARAFDLQDSPPASLAALEDYADGSSGALFRLGLQALGASGEEAAEAGRHAGIAWALTGLLRAAPFHARQRRCYLPRDLMEREGAGSATLFALKPDEALGRVARPVAERAREHIEAARALRHAIPRRALSAMLPVVLAGAYLARIKRNRFDPFADCRINPLSRQARLTVAAIRGRY